MILATSISLAAVSAFLVFIMAMTLDEWQYSRHAETGLAIAGILVLVGGLAAVTAVVNAAFRFLA